MKHEKIFGLLSEIITGICAHKDDLRIFVDLHSRVAATMSVHPHMADYRKLVGRKGVTIEAFRVLAKEIGNAQGLSLVLNLEETDIGEPEPHQKHYSQTFDQAKLHRMVSSLCEWVFARPVEVHVEETETGGIAALVDAPDGITAKELMNHIKAIFIPYGMANGRAVEVRQSKPATTFFQ